MSPLSTVSLIAWISLCPYPILIAVFYLNRYKYPIKGRSPRVAILQAVCIFAFATGQFITNTFEVACDVGSWITYFSGLWAQLCFNYRLIVLLFNYEITQNISELKDNRKLTDLKLNWFTSHRYLAQDKFIVRVAIVLFCTDIIILISFVTLAPSVCGYGPYSAIFSIKGVSSLVLSLVMAFKMWKYPTDAFGIKSEFRSLVFGAISIVLVFSAVSMVRPDLKWVLQIGLIVACQPMLFFTVVVPYYKSTKQKELTGNELQTLENWLTRAEGIKKFREYLETEFSSENLLFYLDVVYLKTLPLDNPGAIKDEISQIYEKFFNQNSPCALNLPSDINALTSASVKRLLSIPLDDLSKMAKEEVLSVFDRAQNDIYRLMASDSFHRFQQTSTFQKVKESLTKSLGQSHGGKSGGSNKSQESKHELDKLLGPQENAANLVSAIREEDQRNTQLEVDTPKAGEMAKGVATPSKSVPHSPSMNSLEASGHSIADTATCSRGDPLERIIDIDQSSGADIDKEDN
jgi:hypothetical protein